MKDQIYSAWAPRAGATLSLLASAVLLKLIITKKRLGKLSWTDLKPNSRFIFMLSIIEALHSIAYMASTSAMPKETSPPIYGAAGDHSTCMVQGFFIQLGLASPLYSMSLSVFYWLTICRGMTPLEFTAVKKVEPLLHGVSLLVPLITAAVCASLGLFEARGSVCWIGAGQRWYSFVFGGSIVLLFLHGLRVSDGEGHDE